MEFATNLQILDLLLVSASVIKVAKAGFTGAEECFSIEFRDF